MKYFEVIGFKLDSEGRFKSEEIIKQYTKSTDAQKFKEFWEGLWKKHTNEKRGIYPCWYDYEPYLRIDEQYVEERFDINKVMYEYSRN